MNNMKTTFPDYEKCIVNLSSSILSSFGADTFHPELDLISKESLKNKQNVILLILDGFGLNLYKKYSTQLPNLNKYFIDQITSVFPSTTSAAITSILTGKNPIEHGAVGWTLYFKEFAKNIDFLPNWDSITTTVQDEKKYNVNDYLGAESIFNLIEKTDPSLKQFHLTEKSIAKSTNVKKVSGNAKIIPFKNTKQLFRKLSKVLKKGNERKFIYAYSSKPDKLEHTEGVYSQSVKNYLLEVDKNLGEFTSKLAGNNTTLLITADHGLIDQTHYFYANEDKKLFDSLILPTFPEPRFISFFVKPHKIEQFLIEIGKYENDFKLLSREDFFQEELLGNGQPHPKIDDFIGNYVMISTSAKAMKSIYMQNGKWEQEFKAHHAGLTAAEMLVPLFRIDL